MLKILTGKTVKGILLTLSLTAVIWFILTNISEIREYNFSVSIKYLILGASCSIIGHLSNYLVWFSLAKGFGIRTTILRGGRAWFLSRMGRYIPGKVPFLLFRLSVYDSFPRKNVALATGVEYVASIGAASLIVLFGIITSPIMISDAIKWVALGCSLLIPILLWPGFLIPSYNFVLKLFGKSAIKGSPSYSLILRSVFGYVIAGLIHGLGFYFLLSSLYNIPFQLFPIITGIYFGAGLIGLAAIFAPGGIGVLEGSMLIVLPSFIPEPVAIVGIMGIRIQVTLTELFITGVFSGLEFLKRKRSK